MQLDAQQSNVISVFAIQMFGTNGEGTRDLIEHPEKFYVEVHWDFLLANSQNTKSSKHSRGMQNIYQTTQTLKTLQKRAQFYHSR